MVSAVAGGTGFHYGHTHKGSPLGCAVGLAVLEETIGRGLIAQAEETGEYLRAQLSGLMQRVPIVGDVRGRGLLNAIEIVANQETRAMLPRDLDVIGDVKALALVEGLLIYGRRSHGGRYGDWIMMTPPLIATKADVDVIVDALGRALIAYADRLVRQRKLS
jgi:adenosylmethionine-8-amino-7-oxononanoate aminotransferase